LVAHTQPGEFSVVTIVDFVGIPPLFHGFALDQVAKHDLPGRAKLLVDEHSVLHESFAALPAQRVDILVIDRDGTLRGRYTGFQEVTAALNQIEALRRQPYALNDKN
jgi:hypothetical protein